MTNNSSELDKTTRFFFTDRIIYLFVSGVQPGQNLENRSLSERGVAVRPLRDACWSLVSVTHHIGPCLLIKGLLTVMIIKKKIKEGSEERVIESR